MRWFKWILNTLIGMLFITTLAAHAVVYSDHTQLICKAGDTSEYWTLNNHGVVYCLTQAQWLWTMGTFLAIFPVMIVLAVFERIFLAPPYLSSSPAKGGRGDASSDQR